MHYTGPMSETRTRNEYGDYVCPECGTTSNFHFSVSYGHDEQGFTEWQTCPNQSRERTPITGSDGMVHGIVQELRKRDEGPYVLFDHLAMRWLAERDNGAFRFCSQEEATVYGGIAEASIRAMLAGGEARPMAV